MGNNSEVRARPSLVDRLAGAPISWGICEVPGWGKQLGVDRVLGEMRSLGLKATELGAAGWLPSDADAINKILGHHELAAMAAFVPLVLHDATQFESQMEGAEQNAALLEAVGASCFVTALVSDLNDWQRPSMTPADWEQVYRGLDQVDVIAAAHGLTQVVHPHANTLVEQADEIELVLAHTEVQFCLDTGHFTLGHADPVAFAREHADRVGLVHLKDVRLAVAERWRSGELTLMEAVQAGMFACLGQGDVAIHRVVSDLEDTGYDGWYVFEQDVAITGVEPPPGEGPFDDVKASVAFMRDLATHTSS